MSEKEENNRKSGSAVEMVPATDAGGDTVMVETCHSHISSMKTSTYGASATSDSAYGGSNTQRSGSGSGSGSMSRSSKSHNSSVSSTNTPPDQQQPKSRREKDMKKRKSESFTPPNSHSVSKAMSPIVEQPANTSSAAAAPAMISSASISAASTAVADACATNTADASTVSKHDTVVAGADTGGSNNSCPGPAGRKKQSKTCRVMQAAALSRALDFLQGTTVTAKRHNNKDVEEAEHPFGAAPQNSAPSCSSRRSAKNDPFSAQVQQSFSYLENEPAIKSKEAFVAAISLQDGTVAYVTSTLTDSLGYPTEMWLKRSLLDFVHPKDRSTFTNQITATLLASIDKEDYSLGSTSTDSVYQRSSSSSQTCNSICCRLRKYKGLRTSGFGIVDKKASYLPFRISLSEKIRFEIGVESKKASDAMDHRTGDEESVESEFYVLAYAVPISSAYKSSDDRNTNGQFGLRHSGTCLFSEVDLGSVPYLGHLPQDLLGVSVLDFYHPNDLAELKNVYNSVICRQGKSVRSKPYHFRAFNGCYVLLQTDWTCFVNPWTKKLEFVAGHHQVLRGPSNPDVFANPPDGTSSSLDNLDAESMETAKKLQAEISTILGGLAQTSSKAQQTSSVEKEFVEVASRRRKNMGFLMGTLIDKVVKSDSDSSCGKVHSPVGGSLLGDLSVVTGDMVSLAGSRCDSPSTRTPLSYSQLNYNQNLDRYFQSQPKMIPSTDSSGLNDSQGSQGLSQTANISSEEDVLLASSSIPSSSNLLSSSNGNSNSGTDSNSGNEFKGLPLTKVMLARHNEDMERKFMQQHRDLRHRVGRQTGTLPEMPHGVKRGQSSSWEEGACGSGGGTKYQHVGAHHSGGQQGFLTTLPVNLLPPFSVSGAVPSAALPVFTMPMMANRGGNSSRSTGANGNQAGSSRTVPTPCNLSACGNRVTMPPLFVAQNAGVDPYSLQQLSYMPGVLYQPVMAFFQPNVMVPVTSTVGATCGVSSNSSSYNNKQQYQQQTERRQQHGSSSHRQVRAGTSHGRSESTRQRQRGPESFGDLPGTSGGGGGGGGAGGSSRQSGNRARQDRQDQQQQQQHQHHSAEEMAQRRHAKNTPHWMESIPTTDQFVYKYQVPGRSFDDILQQDRDRLEQLQQPGMLNDQLLQLYSEMEAEQKGDAFNLETDMERSSTSTEGSNQMVRQLRRRTTEFRQAMIYEENTPLPKPFRFT